MRTRVLIAALCAAGVLAVAACGDDQPSQEKAQSQVCDARTDVRKQVDVLGTLTPSAATLDAIKQSLKAITDDLAKMRDARADLSDERRTQVESATAIFTSELRTAVEDLGSPRSPGNKRTQTQSASAALRDSYRKALEPIDCG
jgi:hypothetical protein